MVGGRKVTAPLQTVAALGAGIAAQKLTAAGLEHFGGSARVRGFGLAISRAISGGIRRS